MFYSEPRILHSKTGTWSVYFSVTSSQGKKRFYRISNGKEFGISGRGNGKEVSLKNKREYFSLLRDKVSARLASGWFPGKDESPQMHARELLAKSVESILRDTSVSLRYKKNISLIRKHLERYFGELLENTPLEVFTVLSLYKFLNSYAYKSSGYFNAQRAHLGAIFSRGVLLGHIADNPVNQIKKMPSRSSSNQAFTQQQVDRLMVLIRGFCPNLYLAVVLMYTTLLRPHIEIRNLRRKYFSEDFSVLVVPGNYTKNKKGRNIPVSPSVSKLLVDVFKLGTVLPDDYIFGRLYNPGYFSTRWRVFKIKYPSEVLENQTLYSFRHSAAIKIFKNSGSVYKVKIAMDHSDISVTLGYLRSLDIYESIIDLSDLPDIEI